MVFHLVKVGKRLYICADDLFIFGYADKYELSNFGDLLSQYCLYLGQSISYAKSNVISSRNAHRTK